RSLSTHLQRGCLPGRGVDLGLLRRLFGRTRARNTRSEGRQRRASRNHLTAAAARRSRPVTCVAHVHLLRYRSEMSVFVGGIMPLPSCFLPTSVLLTLALIGTFLASRAAGLVSAGKVAVAQQKERESVEPEEVRPGLVGAYRSLTDQGAAFTRIDRKPVFYLGDSSPDPRLPPGPFEVVWTGVLYVKDPGPITFDAFVG